MDIEKLLELLDQAIEFQDWDKVDEAIEIIRIEYEDPFIEYGKDQDLSENDLW